MNNYLIETEEYKGYTINVYYDETADYNDTEHLGTFYTNIPRELDVDGHNIDEILDENGVVQADKYVYVIVYAYIHSGISLSTGRGYPFNDPWDSGAGGIMAVSKAKIKKECGHKIVTKKDKEWALEALKANVMELNDYCQGRCWWLEILDADGNNVESIGGYVGDIDYCINDGKEIIDCTIAHNYTKNFEMAMSAFEDCDGIPALSDARSCFHD